MNHALIAMIAIAGSYQDATTLPDTVAGHRFTEFMTAFNSTDSRQVSDMVGRSFAKSALRILSQEEWTNRISGTFNVAPISVDSVLKSSDNMIVVRIKSRSATPLAIRLDLESEVPHGIVGAKMGPPSDVLESTAPRKYANWKALDDLAELVRNDNRLPAMCIGYEQLGQKPVTAFAGVKSTMDRETIESDDRLLVGAIGKTMTATLVARLVDLKKLSWTTTLGQALPGITMQDAYKDLTIDQVLHHLGTYPQHPSLTQDQMMQLVAKGESPTEIRKAYVTSILAMEPEAEASSGNSLDDADFVIAGYIVEHQIGKSFEYLMQRYVFDPMKMGTAMIAPLCTAGQVGSPGNVFGHMPGDRGYVPYQIPGTSAELALAPAGAGISCSLPDLLKFADYHLRGLGGDAHVLTVDSYKHIHGQLNGAGSACGWTLNAAFAGEACHSISTTNGSFYTDLTLWPDKGLVIVATTNAGIYRQLSPTLQAVLAVRDRLEKRG